MTISSNDEKKVHKNFYIDGQRHDLEISISKKYKTEKNSWMWTIVW